MGELLHLLRSVALAPGNPGLLYRFGLQLIGSDRSSEGLICLRRATAISPLNASLQNDYGIALARFGRAEEAIALFLKSMVLECSFAPSYLGLGKALRQLESLRAASSAFRRALTLLASQPRTDLLNALGSCLFQDGQRADAKQSFKMTIALSPGYSQALHNFALAHRDSAVSVYDESNGLVWFDRALSIESENLDFFYSKGCLLQSMGRLQEARRLFDQVIESSFEHAEARWSRSGIDLAEGKFAEGWRGYEWRWRARVARAQRADVGIAKEVVDIDQLNGRSLLLIAEQGLGDTLQFCRYGAVALENGAKVVMQVPDPLLRLLRGQRKLGDVIGFDDSPPSTDLRMHLMSMPLACRTTLESIPSGRNPYLRALPEDESKWSERLRATIGKRGSLRVGLVWNGGFRPDQPEIWITNERRNISLDLIASVLDIPGIEFFSLQKGEPAASALRGREKQYWRKSTMLNFTDELYDFADTAGLMANLDLIISVDTSTAHLAAALGKPTWILNRFDTCWRWLLDRADSPWYPSVTLYRQGSDRDWEAVLRRVAFDLSQLAKRTNGRFSNQSAAER